MFPFVSPSLAELNSASLNKGIITESPDQTLMGFSTEQFSKLRAVPEMDNEKVGCCGQLSPSLI